MPAGTITVVARFRPLSSAEQAAESASLRVGSFTSIPPVRWLPDGQSVEIDDAGGGGGSSRDVMKQVAIKAGKLGRSRGHGSGLRRTGGLDPRAGHGRLATRRGSAGSAGMHTFRLDAALPPETGQAEMYVRVGQAAVTSVLGGVNSTIFAYGQSGTGKTHTMYGAGFDTPEQGGIVPRACLHLFKSLRELPGGTEATVRVQYVEIYNERLIDLLAPHIRHKPPAELQLHEVRHGQFEVNGAKVRLVRDEGDIIECLQVGEENRHHASTVLNADSSRSHSLFLWTVTQHRADGSTMVGKLNLVDLAGSEKVSKTHAEGATLREAMKINQSLSSLGNCIKALVTNKTHIPYRDSQLTKLLQDSLGGNTKTSMVVCCSPHETNLEETLSTLRFAARAKTVKTKPVVNVSLSPAEMQKQLTALKAELEALRSSKDSRRPPSIATAESNKLKKQLKAGQEAAAALGREAKALKTDCEDWRAAAEETELECSLLSKSDASLRAERNGLSQQLSASAALVGSLSRDVETLHAERIALDGSLRADRATLIELQEEAERCALLNEHENKRRAGVEAQAQALQTANDGLREENAEKARDLAALHASLASSERIAEHAGDVQAALGASQQRCDALQAQVAAAAAGGAREARKLSAAEKALGEANADKVELEKLVRHVQMLLIGHEQDKRRAPAAGGGGGNGGGAAQESRELTRLKSQQLFLTDEQARLQAQLTETEAQRSAAVERAECAEQHVHDLMASTERHEQAAAAPHLGSPHKWSLVASSVAVANPHVLQERLARRKEAMAIVRSLSAAMADDSSTPDFASLEISAIAPGDDGDEAGVRPVYAFTAGGAFDSERTLDAFSEDSTDDDGDDDDGVDLAAGKSVEIEGGGDADESTTRAADEDPLVRREPRELREKAARQDDEDEDVLWDCA